MEDHEIARSLLKKLLYFDIFSHPLLANEIIDFCNLPNLDKNTGKLILDDLLNKNILNCYLGYYFFGNDKLKVAQRIEANRLAKHRLKDARKYARIVANFPFVRGVFISGSLSKNVMKPDSDVDFFIITEKGKLWVCRALLTLYKKVILFNSHRNFCLNYFIDQESLEIPDKNIFTATEIAFLLPLYNYEQYLEFMQKNNWYKKEFPNMGLSPEEPNIRPFKTKKVFEILLNNYLGIKFEQLSYQVTIRYWKKKFHDMNDKSFSLNLRSGSNVSKHHPNAFQQKVLKKYLEKRTEFEKNTGFLLTKSCSKRVGSAV